jgi:hypothetical protein
MAGRQEGINALLNYLLPHLAVVELLACDGSVNGEDRKERKREGDLPKMFHGFSATWASSSQRSNIKASRLGKRGLASRLERVCPEC